MDWDETARFLFGPFFWAKEGFPRQVHPGYKIFAPLKLVVVNGDGRRSGQSISFGICREGISCARRCFGFIEEAAARPSNDGDCQLHSMPTREFHHVAQM